MAGCCWCLWSGSARRASGTRSAAGAAAVAGDVGGGAVVWGMAPAGWGCGSAGGAGC